MKKLTLNDYKCKLTVDETNGKYIAYFMCDMDGEFHNTISYDFCNSTTSFELCQEDCVFSILKGDNLELEFGLTNDKTPIVFFSIIDYDLDTSYYLGQKKYVIEINRNTPHYSEFKTIVEAIKVDKKYRGEKQDEYKSYSVKH